jgi:hypothetical protein
MMGELGKVWLRGVGVTVPVTEGGGGGDNQAWHLQCKYLPTLMLASAAARESPRFSSCSRASSDRTLPSTSLGSLPAACLQGGRDTIKGHIALGATDKNNAMHTARTQHNTLGNQFAASSITHPLQAQAQHSRQLPLSLSLLLCDHCSFGCRLGRRSLHPQLIVGRRQG